MGQEDFLDMLTSLDFLPNSPTLFNLGTGQGTLSACFKFDVPDSMEGIMDVATKSAMVQKFGGGVGYALSDLRAEGAPIKSTHGKACGPNAVIRLYQSVAEMVTQGGKRPGAQMGILSVDHPDIRAFIHLKDSDPQRYSTFNISVAVTDSFMEEATVYDTRAYHLFQEIVQSAWNTGDPGLYFMDVAERSNPTPHLGRLTGTNPCGEVPLLDNEACNLGSINLANHLTKNREGIDYEHLERTVRLAVQYLDMVLDRNTFPVPEITEAVAQTRKLGLGVMGWADALSLMGVHYDTAHALNMAENVMYFISHVAHHESRRIASIKGAYPACQDDPRRNATVTCIAPTGSISIIAGVSSGIEPHYATEWIRETADGDMLEESVTTKEGFTPKTAMELPWQSHVAMQAAFQKHTDLAVSKTINLPNSASVNDIREAYILMWKQGCKGGTVFRDGCRSEQVLTATIPSVGETGNEVSTSKWASNLGSTPSSSTNCVSICEPVKQEGCTNCGRCGASVCTV
jgi:ribonucleoside-diphosphate reductase alpha chain